MSTGTPGRPRAIPATKSTDDIISKYFLPFAAAITTAIFYFTGWAYIAHWYGFFGIDASQVNVPIQIILIHGVPGILLLVACGLIALALTGVIAILKQVRLDAGILPFGFIVAAFLAFFFIEQIVDQLPRVGDIPVEVRLSLNGLNVIVLIMVLVLILAGFNVKIEKSFSISTITFVIISLVLIFYFFAAYSTSVLLGEWDAARGRRLMVGDWQIPQVIMYSEKSIPALSTVERKLAGNIYQYAPLSLVASDSNMYYLVDSKTGEFFAEHPKVYNIPRSDDLKISYLVTPANQTVANPTATSEPKVSTLTP
jgi:hypothetical protein